MAGIVVEAGLRQVELLRITVHFVIDMELYGLIQREPAKANGHAQLVMQTTVYVVNVKQVEVMFI
jgi:hypothetical protein